MHTLRRSFAVMSAFTFLALGATACSGSGTSTTAPTTSAAAGAPAATAAVVIEDFTFQPSTLNVKVGDTITVTNEDEAVHTLTADDRSFDTGPLSKGQSATIKVTKAGANPYICRPHPYMRGVITAS